MRKLLLVLCLAVAGSAFGAELKIDFSNYAAGQSPTNFHSTFAGAGGPGDWKIVMDESPPAFAPLMPQVASTAPAVRRPVLAQLGRQMNPDRFPMFIYAGEKFKNFKLTTDLKIVSGAAEQMAGVVFRYQNVSNFYLVSADALNNTFHCFKVENGVWKPPLGPGLKVAKGAWHRLTVQCDGNRILCSLDGNDAIKLADNTYNGRPGKIGFITQADTTAYFGDTTVDYTPLIPPAQALVDGIMKKYPRIVGLRIYMPDGQGELRVIASKDKKEIGRPGAEAERKTLEKGDVFIGHGRHTVAVDMPLDNRNGVPIAAVRVELKSYIFGETQDMVLARVRLIIREMQKQVLSKADLAP